MMVHVLTNYGVLIGKLRLSIVPRVGDHLLIRASYAPEVYGNWAKDSMFVPWSRSFNAGYASLPELPSASAWRVVNVVTPNSPFARLADAVLTTRVYVAPDEWMFRMSDGTFLGARDHLFTIEELAEPVLWGHDQSEREDD